MLKLKIDILFLELHQKALVWRLLLCQRHCFSYPGALEASQTCAQERNSARAQSCSAMASVCSVGSRGTFSHSCSKVPVQLFFAKLPSSSPRSCQCFGDFSPAVLLCCGLGRVDQSKYVVNFRRYWTFRPRFERIKRSLNKFETVQSRT